jgi:hypothetical protein
MERNEKQGCDVIHLEPSPPGNGDKPVGNYE